MENIIGLIAAIGFTIISIACFRLVTVFIKWINEDIEANKKRDQGR